MNQDANNETDSDMLDEYDFSNGVRGKYVDRLSKGSNVVTLDPDHGGLSQNGQRNDRLSDGL